MHFTLGSRGRGACLGTKGGAGGALGRGQRLRVRPVKGGGGLVGGLTTWLNGRKERMLAAERNARTVWLKLFSLFLPLNMASGLRHQPPGDGRPDPASTL